jgi:hypothetical protein
MRPPGKDFDSTIFLKVSGKSTAKPVQQQDNRVADAKSMVKAK